MCSGPLGTLVDALGKIGPLDPTRLLHNKRHKLEKKAKEKRIADNAAEVISEENEGQNNANLELAAARRRRRLSSLLVGGRSVLGAPAGRGAASGSGGPAGGGGGGGGATSGSASYGSASRGRTGSGMQRYTEAVN